MKKDSTTLTTLVALALSLSAPAFAQCDLTGSPETTLRDPLIYGATSTPPLDVAPEGQPPPVGDSFLPAPVTPGMFGPPTLIPSVPTTPANDIESPSYQVGISPYDLAAPGELGPSTYAPPPASTPGDDPGSIHAPLDFYPPPVGVVNINPGGGIPGSPPTQRWGGQTSADFGLYRHRGTKTDDYAQEMQGSSSEDGFNHARNGAKTAQDLYGSRYPLKNSGQQVMQTTANN